MPIANEITTEQAILLAIQSITVKSSVPSVEDIAERAGVSRQYLYKLANRRMKDMGLIQEKSAEGPTTQPRSDTRSPLGDARSLPDATA